MAFDPLNQFLKSGSAGGVMLLLAAILALVFANSPLAPLHEEFLETPMVFRIGGFELSKPLLLWINDGLMAVFFFHVGLELKREILEGHLSTLRTAALPAVAALGGMLVPALIFAGLNRDDPIALRGWAIPAATDIAFALGALMLLGKRVPVALKAFLLSVAIFDDLGSIIIIALFYSVGLSKAALFAAAVFIVALALLNRFGAMRPAAYVLVGIALWVSVLKSGVHATLSGVVLALFIPLKPVKGYSPAHRLETALHPWVAFGVLPVFAFANAAVPLTGLSLADVLHPVTMGVALGLFLGKQVGVLGFAWLGTRLRLAALPRGVGWLHLYGVALLCGIGFTMSLFIASLAYEHAGRQFQDYTRLGILLATVLSGALGYWVLSLSSREPVSRPDP